MNSPVSSAVTILRLPPELQRHPGACGDVGSGNRGLLAGYAAAYGVKLQAEVLGGFDRAAHGFADERRDFDSALLNVEDYGSGGRQFCLGVRVWSL